MRLMSESPFIWVYNQTLPTKPNLPKWLFLTSECLFLRSESLFLTSECLFLTSKSPHQVPWGTWLIIKPDYKPFIWAYNQTLPTKPNMSESLFPMMFVQHYFSAPPLFKRSTADMKKRSGYGKLESGSPWEVQQVPQIIYKISGSQRMALDLVRSTEKAGSSKVAESMYKYLQTHIEVLKLCIIKSANK